MIRPVVHEGHAAVELVHGSARLVIVHDLGPRIAWFGRRRGENLLYWDGADTVGRGRWRIRGGHRVWTTRPLADESEETYAVDDRPCRVRRTAGAVVVSAPVDDAGLVRSIAVRGAARGFVVESRVRNAGELLWSGGVWALTCTRPRRHTTYGIPLGAKTPEPWDVFTVVVPRRWGGHTSAVADPQLRFTEQTLIVSPRGRETKRMIQAPQGTIVMSDPTLGSFRKIATYDPDATYPLACNLAVYVAPDNLFVEVETMSGIVTVPPGRELRHAERWILDRPLAWR